MMPGASAAAPEAPAAKKAYTVSKGKAAQNTTRPAPAKKPPAKKESAHKVTESEMKERKGTPAAKAEKAGVAAVETATPEPIPMPEVNRRSKARTPADMINSEKNLKRLRNRAIWK